VPISAKIAILPEDLLMSWLPEDYLNECQRKVIPNAIHARSAHLNNAVKRLNGEIRDFKLKILSWSNSFETVLRRKSCNNLADLHRKADLILSGLRLACSLRAKALDLTALHHKLNVPMTK